MVIREAELETVCGITSRLPRNIYPEIAFTGRSNVGKSSLINTLMHRKRLAYTSSKPGKTQTINYYLVNKCMYLVDLPGYGYASSSVENRAAWGEMISNYLTGSDMLRYVFLLVDIRHDPSEDDRKMYDWLKYLDLDPVVICTKSDKLKPREIDGAISNIGRCLGADEDAVIIPFSSEDKTGLDIMEDFMTQVLENEKK